MTQFNNILFIHNGISQCEQAIRQALSLTKSNNAKITCLLLSPEVTHLPEEYKNVYISGLKNNTKNLLKKISEESKYNFCDLEIICECTSTPAINAIKFAIKNSCDLIIKQAEIYDLNQGFVAQDMDLLRKSHIPVWLARNINNSKNEIKVAVAIDPKVIEESANELSVKMLKLANSISQDCNKNLQIISAWEYLYENDLRNNFWIKISEEELNENINQSKFSHRKLLDELIKKANLTDSYKVNHIKGSATKVIPNFINENKIDILIMGTVARTGIPGFIIGNTAEDILRKLNCSLLALKPAGFVSPIKPY